MLIGYMILKKTCDGCLIVDTILWIDVYDDIVFTHYILFFEMWLRLDFTDFVNAHVDKRVIFY